ncbi:MAG TPA: winged helix-turn-helix transcriptional regulator [Ilumatobacter sp.]|nr:winged helix-turn-helix transcriptional regulator [Ilumatobacter sp.]
MSEPLDASAVRRSNRRAVLNELRRAGTTNRSPLAAATGLTAPTVRALVDDLVRCGLAELDAPAATGSLGRPANIVRYPGRDWGIAVLQFGPTYHRVSVTDGTGHQMALVRTEATKHTRRAVTRAVATAHSLASEHGLRLVTGVAVVTGRVDGGTVDSELLGWRCVELEGLITSALGVPVTVHNASLAAGYRELCEGAGTKVRRFVVIDSSNDVSGVTYVDGQLVTMDPVALGELPVSPNDRTTVFEMAGMSAMLRRYRAETGVRATRVASLISAADSGDTRARQVVVDACRALSFAARWLIALAAPEQLVLSGALVDLPPEGRHMLRDLISAEIDASVPVVFSDVGSFSWVRGGELIGVDQVRVLEDATIASTLG